MAAKQITTPIFRASFPSLAKARPGMDGGEPKFGVTAVWDPKKMSARDKERWKAMIALADEVSMAAFKKKLKDLPANFKKGLRDGEEKEGMAGFGAGLKFANLTTKRKPGIVAQDGETKITDEADIESECYPGCYMRATVTCYSYDNKGKGIAFGLQNLQKVGNGPRLDTSSDPSKDFKDDELSAEDEKWLEAEEAAAELGNDSEESEDDDNDF